MRWETINAYIDGELSPDESKVIAERAARDPTLRARIATFSRLKGTTAEAMRRAQPARTRDVAYRSARGMVAAGVALLLVVAVGLLVPLKPQDRTETGTVAYWTWLAGAELAGMPQSGPLEIGNWRGSAPDLEPAHLRLVLVAPGTRPGQEVLLGYQGSHGCRVGLWISRSLSAEEKPSVANGDIQTVQWTIGDTNFLLLARGMDGARLAVLARAVEHLTRDHNPDQVHVALSQSAEIGRPCTG